MTDDYALLKMTGKETEKLLQGQLTVDVSKLAADQLQLAAHCNPQGRIVTLGYLTQHQSDYYFFIPSDMAEIALNTLKKYAVFYKVGLEIVPASSVTLTPPTKLERIQAGIPAVYAKTSGMFLPHELNLPELQAVSFDKGCYIGQEIIARMHYRGKLKKHLYRAEYDSSNTPLPGSDLYTQNVTASEANGIVVDALQLTPTHGSLLLVCDETHAKNHQLSLNEDHSHYVTFLN